MRVLARDADSERQTAGREVRERRQLARHEHRVPKRQLIDTDVHADAGMDSGERSGGDQAVDAVTTAEGHVIDAADMVEAGRGRGRDRVARALVERFDRHDAKANVAQEIRPHHDRARTAIALPDTFKYLPLRVCRHVDASGSYVAGIGR